MKKGYVGGRTGNKERNRKHKGEERKSRCSGNLSKQKYKWDRNLYICVDAEEQCNHTRKSVYQNHGYLMMEKSYP